MNYDVTVVRNDKFDLDDISKFDKILLSPGPGIPDEAGLLKKVIEKYGPTKSILGICLGQQAIAEVYGGSLKNLDEVFHGISSNINLCVKDESIFHGIKNNFQAARYHSWVVDNISDQLEITSVDDNNQIMSIRHTQYDVKGVQFHPESILTPYGKKIIENWINN
jgi:anthranilate synthase component 2